MKTCEILIAIYQTGDCGQAIQGKGQVLISRLWAQCLSGFKETILTVISSIQCRRFRAHPTAGGACGPQGPLPAERLTHAFPANLPARLVAPVPENLPGHRFAHLCRQSKARSPTPALGLVPAQPYSDWQRPRSPDTSPLGGSAKPAPPAGSASALQAVGGALDGDRDWPGQGAESQVGRARSSTMRIFLGAIKEKIDKFTF